MSLHVRARPRRRALSVRDLVRESEQAEASAGLVPPSRLPGRGAARVHAANDDDLSSEVERQRAQARSPEIR
jgi:hypothetical protein